MKRLSLLVLIAMVLSLGLTACGGGGGAGGAATAAKSFFDAFGQLDFAKIKDLTCDAQKQTIDIAMQAMGAGGDIATIKEMIKIDTSGLKFEEKSVNGSNATVVVSGKMKIETLGQSRDRDVNNKELPMISEGGQWKVCGADALLLQ